MSISLCYNISGIKFYIIYIFKPYNINSPVFAIGSKRIYFWKKKNQTYLCLEKKSKRICVWEKNSNVFFFGKYYFLRPWTGTVNLKNQIMELTV